MLDLMREKATYNLLRWATGRQIFCPVCDSILDWSTTTICGGLVLCDTCYADNLQRIVDKYGADETLAILDRADVTSAHNWHVVDGRVELGSQLITDE